MTADEMRRAAEYLTEQARMYRAAGAPVAATERSILSAKLRAMADAAESRVLAETDPYCPSCGHNRNDSSVSSIAHEDGTCSCQICGARWTELPPPPEAK